MREKHLEQYWQISRKPSVCTGGSTTVMKGLIDMQNEKWQTMYQFWYLTNEGNEKWQTMCSHDT